MDGAQASRSTHRTWADVVNSASPRAMPETQSSRAVQAPTRSPASVNPRRDAAALRYATPHQRLQNSQWGVANNSILEDPHVADPSPFAGFPLEFLSLKSDYILRFGGEQMDPVPQVPVFQAAAPDFSAIFHLNNVLMHTLDNNPSALLRDTLGLAECEYLVIPLDRALAELDAEYITRARFSLQHLASMAQTPHFPIRFSVAGEVTPAGTMAERLSARVQARDQLNGFWLTFTHYAETCSDADKTAYVQSQTSPLISQYLSYAHKPALQEAMGQLARFFNAVFKTADFNETGNRSVLLQQLMDIYTAVCADEYLLETLAQEARENMTNCADRRALVLGDMTMAVIMHQSHGMGSEALFDTGLRIMRVHIADQHAFEAAQLGREDETIEVLLRFRTALADYGLAVSGRTMAHEAVAQVEQDAIDHAAQDIDCQTRDLTQVQAFFQHCTPWLEHVESLHATELSALSDKAQHAMAALHDRRDALSDHAYVQACDNLMHRWQADKSHLISQASDQLVASLHAAYWRQDD